MDEIVIKIENLSKYYQLGVINTGVLFRDIQTWIAKKSGKPNPHSKIGQEFSYNDVDGFWALKDINLDIHQGDRVGIIGKNGAGKSTLLKILSQITAPTEGRFRVKGRITSLLEVGTGFNGELTGRENIFLNGAILGMRRREVSKKLDEIIAFSEIEKHIDTPAKRYSSGMYVRLAFAVAAHLDSEILIADEVLAVGDANFQKKALGKMNEISTGQGRTVLFVSHNMASIRQLCNKGVMLEKGRVILNADIDDCINVYIQQSKEVIQKDLINLPRVTRNCSYAAKIKSFAIHNEGCASEIVNSSLPCECIMEVEVMQDDLMLTPEFELTDGTQHISIFHAGLRSNYVEIVNKGVHVFRCRTAPMNLYSGEYFIDLALSSPGSPVDYIENAYSFKVEYQSKEGQSVILEKNMFNGFTYIDYDWKLLK